MEGQRNININVSSEHKVFADISLLAVTMVWGTTFVVVKNALDGIGAFWFIGIRFWLAFGVLALIYHRRLIRGWSEHVKLAGIVGLTLFIGFAFQTIGLKYTTASNSGFITGLSVVLVPIVGRWWGHSRPNMATKVGIAGAVIGLGLLTFNKELSFNIGDVLTVISAVAFACHIAMIGYYAPRHDAVVLATMQIGAVAIAGTVCGLIIEDLPRYFSREVWIGLAATAIPATAVAFLLQNTMQKYTTPTRTAIIFAMEPVFAGLTAYLVLGEVLSLQQIMGCIFILSGMLLSELYG